MRKSLWIGALLAVFVSTSAAAAPIILTGPYQEVYNQQDSPCIIGYSCGPNLGIIMTTWSGSVPSEGTDASPTYSGANLTNLINLVGLTPMIAIDVNQEGGVDPTKDSTYYLLDYVHVFDGDTLIATFDNSTAWAQVETGNGNSDYVLKGLDLTGVTNLRFDIKWGNFDGTFGDNNNGKELYFLVRNDTPQVPEPASMLLLGSGLIGLAGAARRRLARKK